MHRDLGVIVGAKKVRASQTDGAITKSGSLGGASNNSDVLGHT
ncbi:MAG: hypothetical protein ABSC65_21900 [Acidobacteriaceae bacterium]